MTIHSSGSNSTSRRSFVRLASVGLAAFLFAAAASPTAAATDQVGQHGRAEVTCFAGKRMLVQVPFVNAAPVSNPSNIVSVGGSFGGGTNIQEVGVRFWLIKWNPTTRQWHYTDQNRDGRLDYTAELRITTTSDGPLVGYGWWNIDANRSIAAGDLTFQVQESGYYMVNTQYFWYTNGQVTGYDLLTSQRHFVAEYFYVAKEYCTF